MPAIGTAIGVPFVHQFGGVLAPWDQDQIVQWLIDYSGDFVYLDKAVAPQLDPPINVGVPVLAFVGLQEVKFPEVILSGDFEVEARIQLVQDGSSNHWLFSNANGVDGAIFTRTGTNIFGVRIAGTVYTDGASDSSILYDGDFHDLVVNRVGANVMFTVDGSLAGTVIATSGDIPISQMFRQGTSVISTMEGYLAYAKLNSHITLVCANQLPYDVSGNGNHATTSTATLSTADDIPDHLTRYGYTFDTPDYIPALTDLVAGVRLDARDGLPIGVVGSIDEPLWYNGSPSNKRAVDAYYFTVGNYPNFWVDAGGLAIDRTPAEIEAWISFTYNALIQWKVDTIGTAGRCTGKELLQYAFDYAFDLIGYNKALKYIEQYTDQCGGGALELAIDVNGNYAIDVNTNYAIAASGD